MTEEQIAAVIRAASCQPEGDCPDGCQVHWSAASNGVVEEVQADVDGLARLIAAALRADAGPGSTSPEPGPPAAILADGPVSELATEVHGLLGALGRRARERREPAAGDGDTR